MSKDTLQPANARTLGAAIRKTLKSMNLPWKVSAKTVSFSGFGYGSMPFAEIETERQMVYMEMSVIAAELGELRTKPTDEGGGKAIVRLQGSIYPFGGAIGYSDYPTGRDFWERYAKDSHAYSERLARDPKLPSASFRYLITPVTREAERRAAIAYELEETSVKQAVWVAEWLKAGAESPEVWGSCWPDIYSPDGPLRCPSGVEALAEETA